MTKIQIVFEVAKFSTYAEIHREMDKCQREAERERERERERARARERERGERAFENVYPIAERGELP